mmetsp:Transcript_6166/g.12529  ORF Transcript_6166/g.12529 Transcript_6166/m.12529 type:complete len:137 (+) Transcript_6166:120-530(+)
MPRTHASGDIHATHPVTHTLFPLTKAHLSSRNNKSIIINNQQQQQQQQRREDPHCLHAFEGNKRKVGQRRGCSQLFPRGLPASPSSHRPHFPSRHARKQEGMNACIYICTHVSVYVCVYALMYLSATRASLALICT